MEDQKQLKKNLWFYPLGTVGRDMIYSLFTYFIYLYILYTKHLTDAQLVAVTAIMVAARVFDAINDPVMGNIIERTRTKWGKYKPWLLIGVLTTGIVVYLAFNTDLTGWSFIIFFGVIYFAYSITYTMNDISYWGMVAALSSDGNMRNTFTSRATLFAGVGGTLVQMLVPVLTNGDHAWGGNAQTAYGRIALIVCVLAPLFLLFTLIGVRERRDDLKKEAPKVSFKKIWGTIRGNDQLLWMILIFLVQQIGNSFVLQGVGSTYVYFTYGYSGGLYSLFSTVGVAATAVIMVLYPALSRKFKRKQLMKFTLVGGLFGYVLQLLSGFLLSGSTIGFWVLTIGYMLSNVAFYTMYLIMMISIINTVEYNEYQTGERDEAIITSMRPFITKLASALVIALTSLTYIITNVLNYTNQIADLETQANTGAITSDAKNALIDEVVATVPAGHQTQLLLVMVFLPLVFLLAAFFLYRKHYKLDEEEYDRICAELDARKASE